MTKDVQKTVEAAMTDPFTAANFRKGIQIYRGQEAMAQNEAYRAQGRAEALEALLKQRLAMDAAAEAAAEAAKVDPNAMPASIAANAEPHHKAA